MSNAGVGPVTTVGVSAPSSSNAITAGAVASANGGGGEATGSTRINSVEDLKKKAPKVYKMMMEGVAMSICRDMEHHQDHLKELMREGRRES